MTTLRLVATAAGVHVATASAVLNGAGGNTRVSDKTRRRVLEAARHLSYVPNEMARRLRTGRSNVVGFLGGDFRNPFFAELTAALERELARHDLQMMVAHFSHAEPQAIERSVGTWRQERVKSIVCWEESAISPSPRKKTDSILSIGFTREERAGVWLDLEYAIERAVEEMIRRGFRRLGFFFPKDQTESPSVVTRSQAFVDICRQHPQVHPLLAFYEGESWDLPASIRGAARVLKDHPEVEAWIGFNDLAALGLFHHLPAGSSSRVICFDGTIPARCWPGSPSYLDLKIPEFAQTIASVAAGEKDAAVLGQRKNWLRPSLAN